jgi:UDP-N-acetylmuramoyl-tripeptide--D-alanyl-D-alanine ligase
MTKPALWTIEAMASAMGARREGALPDAVHGLSIDSRSIGPGEAFFAIKGDNRDGHEFVKAALDAGASLAVVAADKRAQFAKDAPLLVVPDVLEGLRDLARASRARSKAKVIGVTGSVGKTSTKEALRLALAPEGETHASVASYNNHWGVPLSLARCPETARFAIFEMGMNHAGEIEPLVRLVRPHVAIVTTVEPVHLEFFPSIEAIADAKSEIFLGLEPDGAAVLNHDNPQYERLRRKAKDADVARIVSFGAHEQADARLLKHSLHPDCSTAHASILGTEVTYKIGAPGYHLVVNSLAVLAAVALTGGDLTMAALALAELKPATGRGARVTLGLPGGATALLIDESYNANPASMRAALALLGGAAIGPRGRRIAVLGDMLELGAKGPTLHRDLSEAVLAHAVDMVFCSGPLMHELWEALPSERRGGYAKTAAELESSVLAVVRPGDAIMVKGSLGSRMGPLVKALERRYPCHVAREEAPAQG